MSQSAPLLGVAARYWSAISRFHSPGWLQAICASHPRPRRCGPYAPGAAGASRFLAQKAFERFFFGAPAPLPSRLRRPAGVFRTTVMKTDVKSLCLIRVHHCSSAANTFWRLIKKRARRLLPAGGISLSRAKAFERFLRSTSSVTVAAQNAGRCFQNNSYEDGCQKPSLYPCSSLPLKE